MTIPRTALRPTLPATYLVWLGGATVSQLGDVVLGFAVGWAAAADGGPTAGLVLAAGALPRVLLLLAGGATGDRFGARRVMIAGDAAMLVVSVALAFAVLARGTPLWLLLTASVASGVVSAFYTPSSGSMPRRLVPDEALTRALALRQGAGQAVLMLGGPLAGMLVAAGGLSLVAWLDAVTFTVVLGVLVAIRPRYEMPPPVGDPPVRAAFDGLRVVRRTPGLGAALVLVGGAAAFLLPTGSLLIPLLAHDAGWDAAATGFMLGAQGLGLIVATLLVARGSEGQPGARSARPLRVWPRRPGPAACAGLVVASAGQAGLALGAHLGPVWPAVAAGAAVGAGTGLFTAHLAPLVLGSSPRTHLARVQAVVALVQSLALLGANPLLGAVAGATSAGVATAVCAAGLLVCAAFGVWALGARAFGARAFGRSPD